MAIGDMVDSTCGGGSGRAAAGAVAGSALWRLSWLGSGGRGRSRASTGSGTDGRRRDPSAGGGGGLLGGGGGTGSWISGQMKESRTPVWWSHVLLKS